MTKALSSLGFKVKLLKRPPKISRQVVKENQTLDLIEQIPEQKKSSEKPILAVSNESFVRRLSDLIRNLKSMSFPSGVAI